MKIILTLIAAVTMAANIIITLQTIKLRKKICIMNKPTQKEELIFHLPRKEHAIGQATVADMCEETMVL